MRCRASHIAMLGLLTSIGLTGCAILPKGGSSDDGGRHANASLPQLGAIRSRVTPTEPPKMNDPAPTRRVSTTIQQLEIPLHTNLDESWTLTNERVLAEQAREVWNANGVRVGLLSMAAADEFFDAVPYVINVRRARLISGRHPSALRTSPVLHEPVQIDLTGVQGVGEDAAMVTVEGGRMRLLIDTIPNAGGGVTVTLLPHHQLRRLTLQPRDPLEKEMDGRVFEELAVSFDMGGDDVLVLGLYWPWPEEPEDASEQPDGPDEAGAPWARLGDDELVHPWEPGAAEGPTLAPHFGRAMFASRRSSDALQRVMLVHVQPTGGDSAPASRPRTRTAPQTPAN